METSPDRITEQIGKYKSLDSMSTHDVLQAINAEDQLVALAVKEVIPQITQLVDRIYQRFSAGGRLFYLGAGTSGRMGVLDASEIPPTFGYPHDRVIGLIAGGDAAIRKAVEYAEDDREQGWKDLLAYDISTSDSVIGIASSGTTPYVVGAITAARSRAILTACITNNPQSALAEAAEHPITVVVGPEIVTGSTRMKGGTSQKLVLNMISTALMIRMGRVTGSQMVHMQLNNDKLVQRAIHMVMQHISVTSSEARALLAQHGSVHGVITHYKAKN